ncbi:class I SAM-dependent methyltransferase [Rummeliibacillus sp. JY-2-4R]
MANRYIELLAQFGIGGAHPGGFPLTQSIFEEIAILPSQKVLDIGCGTGQTAAFLAEHFKCDVTVIDNNYTMIEKATRRFKKKGLQINTILGDVQNMDFGENAFDFVISESVISFTNISKTLNEVERVLKKDGTFILIEMTAEHNTPKKVRKKVSKLYEIQEILNENEWITKLQQVGFKNINKISNQTLIIPSDLVDMDASEIISMDLYNLWEKHNKFIEKYGEFIKFRVLKCSKT